MSGSVDKSVVLFVWKLLFSERSKNDKGESKKQYTKFTQGTVPC